MQYIGPRGPSAMNSLSMFFPNHIRRAGGGLAGMGAYLRGLGTSAEVVDLQAITTGINTGSIDINALPALARDIYIAFQQGELQSKLLDINLERAKNGQAPLNVNPASLSPQVNFGLSPDTQNMLIMGALALGAVMLIKGRKRGRR